MTESFRCGEWRLLELSPGAGLGTCPDLSSSVSVRISPFESQDGCKDDRPNSSRLWLNENLESGKKELIEDVFTPDVKLNAED